MHSHDNLTVENTSSELMQFVSFHLDKSEFLVDILNIQEIIRATVTTRIPSSPEYLDGMINLRGKLVPVIDLRTRLGYSRSENNERTRIVIVDMNNVTVGLVVDNVNEVVRVSKDLTEPPPASVGAVSSEYISSLVKLEDRILILLELNKVIN